LQGPRLLLSPSDSSLGNVFGPGPPISEDETGSIALSDTRLGDPTSASASLKDASLVERCRRCRPFGDAYSDVEIAAAANDVTARFGAVGSRLTAENVASLRLTR
jgi:hypothetical protein